MKVIKPIADPVPDESIVGVNPVPGPDARAGWRQRLHLYTGRSLSDVALSTEQKQRAGRLATSGQSLSPGVVAGLEVDLERNSTAAGVSFAYRIATGTGLTVAGEDVWVPRDLRVPVLSVPVYAPRALLGSAVTEGDAAASDGGDSTGRLVARMVGAPLGDLLGRVDMPRVGVLVLQPVVAELVGAFNPADPCEQDPQNFAFEDWQLADGCRLLYYAWPSEWLSLPARREQEEQGERWRNRIAYTIFTAELTLGAQEVLPWEELGVPIALVAFDTDATWTPLFVDRYAVVRQGGRPKRRTPLIDNAGHPFLWQARFQQFAEQVTEFAPDGDLSRLPIAALPGEFRYLPPVGLLPTSAVNLSAGRGNMRDQFFPYAYDVEVAPIPLEQLDVVLNENASLAPFDTFAPDQVRVLIPVPQQWFEPELLRVESVAALFQETIDRFALTRAEWLRRRANVRGKTRGITRSLSGVAPEEARPEDDPGRLEDEDENLLRVRPLSPGAGAHQAELRSELHQHFFTGATPPFAINAGDSLVAYVYLDPLNPPGQVMLQWHDGSWEHRAYWGANRINVGVDGTPSCYHMGALPEAGCWIRLEVPATAVGLEGRALNGMAFTLFDGRAAWAHAGRVAAGVDTVWFETQLPPGAAPNALDPVNESWLWVERDNLLAPFEENYQTAQANGLRQVVPIQTLRQTLAAGPLTQAEVAELDNRGLERFILYLEDKVKRAEARIDFGYLRVNTDIYRIRQLVLGTEAATRLAISPALASIAQTETAAASQEQIASFYQRLQASAINQGDDAGGAGAAPAGEAPAGGGAPSPLLDLATPLFATTTSSPFRITQPGLEVSAAPRLPLSEFLAAETAIRLPQPAVPPPPTAEDVIGKSPIVGKVVNRTTTIAERFQTPKAPEAKNYTTATKHDVIRSIADLDISLQGITVPGLATAEIDPTTGQPRRESRALSDFTDNDFRRILADPDGHFRDEAAFFAAGVDLLDHTVAVLGALEGRVQGYRQAVEACRQTLQRLLQLSNLAKARLQVIDDELAEARHDVSVARALLSEESARINAINQRRDQIVNVHVKFLMFYRPRTNALLTGMPARPLNPAFAGETALACLKHDVPLPRELRGVVTLLREAPVRWFVNVRSLLDRLDRPEPLREALQAARVKAQVQPALSGAMPLPSPTASLFGNALQKVFIAQQQVVEQQRLVTAQLDLHQLAIQNWGLLRDQARDVLSLGDVIEGWHGRSDVAQRASSELDNLVRVTACVYRAFGSILPAIRLQWAETLSQFDAPVNLRNLASLPRWGDIEYLERREMQAMVDWLYQRVDPREAQGVALVSDLVRIAILLASHAPVEQIIAGHIAAPVTVQPGGRVNVAVDLSRVRIGMQVLVYQDNEVTARGVVEDLSAVEAAARIVQTSQQTVHIDQNARVQFLEPAASVLTPVWHGGA